MHRNAKFDNKWIFRFQAFKKAHNQHGHIYYNTRKMLC